MKQKIICKILIKKGLTVSVAESCTGGLLSKLLTDIPGSSAYFLGSVVAYSNSSKINLLSIPSSKIKKYGAVSKEVAVSMAKNARLKFKSETGIGITGIAGPAGGTIKKPVGLVYIAISLRKKSICEKFILTGKRNAIRARACAKAVDMIRKAL